MPKTMMPIPTLPLQADFQPKPSTHITPTTVPKQEPVDLNQQVHHIMDNAAQHSMQLLLPMATQQPDPITTLPTQFLTPIPANTDPLSTTPETLVTTPMQSNLSMLEWLLANNTPANIALWKPDALHRHHALHWTTAKHPLLDHTLVPTTNALPVLATHQHHMLNLPVAWCITQHYHPAYATLLLGQQPAKDVTSTHPNFPLPKTLRHLLIISNHLKCIDPTTNMLYPDTTYLTLGHNPIQSIDPPPNCLSFPPPSAKSFLFH